MRAGSSRSNRCSGFAWEQSLQRAFLALPDLVAALNIFYFVGHFLFTAIFFVWLYRRSRDGFSSFRDGFLAATAIAVVIHWLFPTAPPRLAGVGLEDTLLMLSGIDIGSQTSSALSNPVAAVPSLHAAYALGVGIGMIRFARSHLARLAGALYPPLVVLTIVVTGNHFLLDAVAGMLVLALGFMLVRALPPPPRRASPSLRRLTARALAESGGLRYNRCRVAGWSSQVARRAHNPEVAGSNPAPATGKAPETGLFSFAEPEFQVGSRSRSSASRMRSRPYSNSTAKSWPTFATCPATTSAR